MSAKAKPLDAFQPLRDGPEAVRNIIERVLKLEQEHAVSERAKAQ